MTMLENFQSLGKKLEFSWTKKEQDQMQDRHREFQEVGKVLEELKLQHIHRSPHLYLKRNYSSEIVKNYTPTFAPDVVLH